MDREEMERQGFDVPDIFDGEDWSLEDRKDEIKREWNVYSD